MCEGGRIVQHLARTIDDDRNTICLVSYQATRTLGRQILDRPHRVHFLGKDWPLWADVQHLEGFSGHADQGDLLQHLAPWRAASRALHWYTANQPLLTHWQPSSKLSALRM